MPRLATVLDILIASPNDVPEARNTIEQAIYRWNAAYSRQTAIVLQPVRWETHFHPQHGDRPQQILNKQIVENSDILIAVFWTRLGTDTGVFPGGAVEEIDLFYHSGKPIAIYFSDEPVSLETIDINQIQRLKEFKEEIKDKGIHGSFSSSAALREQLATHLPLILERFMKSPTYAPPPAKQEEDQLKKFTEECQRYLDKRVGSADRKPREAELAQSKHQQIDLTISQLTAVHVIPYDVFQNKNDIDLKQILPMEKLVAQINEWDCTDRVFGKRKLKNRFNGRGLLFYDDYTSMAGEYIQIGNNGLIEAVDNVGVKEQDNAVPATILEYRLRKIVSASISIAQFLKRPLPLAISIAIFDTGNRFQWLYFAYCNADVKKFDDAAHKDRNYIGKNVHTIRCPLILLEEYTADIDRVLMPSFNYLAQSAGFPSSPNFDEECRWCPLQLSPLVTGAIVPTD